MKKIALFASLFICIILFACSKHEGFVGKFVNEHGTVFELRADSTGTILFQDSIDYECTWASHFNEVENFEYATVEFGGNPTYYFVRDNQIYRSKQGMMSQTNGVEISWKN